MCRPVHVSLKKKNLYVRATSQLAALGVYDPVVCVYMFFLMNCVKLDSSSGLRLQEGWHDEDLSAQHRSALCYMNSG